MSGDHSHTQFQGISNAGRLGQFVGRPMKGTLIPQVAEQRQVQSHQLAIEPLVPSVIWIDQQNFIPLKIEYYDKSGLPWKTLNITWQKKYDLWFWRKAEVINLQEELTTFITIEDLRANLGLPDRDFTRNSLDRKILGF